MRARSTSSCGRRTWRQSPSTVCEQRCRAPRRATGPAAPRAPKHRRSRGRGAGSRQPNTLAGLLRLDQRLVQPARRACRRALRTSTSTRREVRVRRRPARGTRPSPHCTSPTRRSVTARSPSCVGLLRVEAAAASRVGFGIAPNVLVDERERLRLVELAGDEQHRVVGLVVLAVERLQPVDRHVLDVGARADRRLAVVVPEVRGRERRAPAARWSGCSRRVSNSLRTTVISLSRSFLAMNELTMRSASSSSAQPRFSSVAGKVSK